MSPDTPDTPERGDVPLEHTNRRAMLRLPRTQLSEAPHALELVRSVVARPRRRLAEHTEDLAAAIERGWRQPARLIGQATRARGGGLIFLTDIGAKN